MEEISAGGVVVNNGKVAVLKKFRGEWVLPKGRLEKGEEFEDTALREVKEESGLDAEIVKYIGYVKYNYKKSSGERVLKTVHYYYMQTDETTIIPQREEGFASGEFIEFDRAIRYLKHSAEKKMIKMTKDFYKKEG